MMSSVKKISQSRYYNKQQLLGKGQYGQVFLGFDELSHQPIAVKILNLEKIQKQPNLNAQAFLDKIRNQITNLQIGVNDHLVRLIDVQASKKHIYLICQYCNGLNFQKYLESKGRLTEPEAILFLKDILSGFKSLNEKGIVHRDLKPANLLMHDYSIKIADLGFSKLILSPQEMLKSVVGTPLYMSPQIFSSQLYTNKTDIWSLGIILFQMLYGKMPWVAKNYQDYQNRIKTQPVEFPPQPHVTENTKKLIRSMLQPSETNRINWQDIFQSYFQNKQNNKNTYEYFKINFTRYVSLETPQHGIRILKELNVLYKQQTNIKHNNNYQFFTYHSKVKSMKNIFNGIHNYYLMIRNQLSFLAYIFCSCYDFMISNQASLILLSIMHKTMFLIIKFMYKSLLNINTRTPSSCNHENYQVYKQTQQKYKLDLIFQHDIKTIEQFYPDYMEFFQRQIEMILQKQPTTSTILISIRGMYSLNDGTQQFINFLHTQSMKQLFNIIRNNCDCRLSRIGWMIFQFQRNKNMFNMGDKEYVDLYRRYQIWDNTDYTNQIQNQKDLPVEPISSFISSCIDWNDLKNKMELELS